MSTKSNVQNGWRAIHREFDGLMSAARAGDGVAELEAGKLLDRARMELTNYGSKTIKDGDKRAEWLSNSYAALRNLHKKEKNILEIVIKREIFNLDKISPTPNIPKVDLPNPQLAIEQ